MTLADFWAAQRARAFLWTPVFFAGGIGLYFALPFEPQIGITGGSLALLVILYAAALYKIESEGLRYFLISLLLIATGLMAAQIRTAFVYTPQLTREIGPVIVQARVLEVESLERAGDKRLLLGDVSIEKLLPADTPRRIRLRIRKDPGIKVGERIELLARLMPLSSPTIPGGFDFQRHFYFQGIGAVGFVYTFRAVLEQAPPAWLSIETLRQGVREKVESAIKGGPGGVVEALMINEVSSIPEDDKEAMRVSGLAHMLSISGLHVALVAGGVFFAIRLLLVLAGFGLTLPVKKIAAVAGFAAAIFYMFLAGSNIPVQRSVLMSGVVFLAIIFDRFPLSLRLVAFAAFVVLAVAPESLLSPSFQMSFAAVTALIWFYDGSRERWAAYAHEGGWWRSSILYFAGICATTLIASTATAPIGVYHFQSFGVYSLPANLMAVPVLSFIVMPAAVMALIAMPFGWEQGPLTLMGWGSAYILEVAHWAESLPGAAVKIPMIPFTAFLMLVLAALMGMLLEGRTKFLALIPLVLSLVALMFNTLPDVLVADKGKLEGVLLDNGRLALSSARREKFTAEVWESALGLEKGSAIDWKDAGLPCDELGCRFEKQGKKIAFSMRPEAQGTECHWADVVIADYALQGGCTASVMIDRRDLYHNGAYALWLTGERIRVENAGAYRGARPWTGADLKL
ncbi:MAG: ComEC family competence protein [Alphaproteobacteria bacterium]|nr:ComEC family competence protein [Alphaproteobacteria bacterium]